MRREIAESEIRGPCSASPIYLYNAEFRDRVLNAGAYLRPESIILKSAFTLGMPYTQFSILCYFQHREMLALYPHRSRIKSLHPPDNLLIFH